MDRVTPWLVAKLSELQPTARPDLGLATMLGRMVEQLFHRSGMVSGMVLADNYDRDAVLAHGQAIMEQWLPHLPAATLRSYATLAQTASLTLDIARYLPAAEQRDREQTAAAEAARLAKLAAFEVDRANVAKLERNPALEAALDDDSAAAFDVYADWLEGKGRIRGELIHRMLRAEANRTHLDEIDAFIAEHAEELLGDVPDADCAKLEWRRGFIDELALDSDDGIQETLEHFLGHPSGRRLRSLVVGMNGEAAEEEEQGSFLETVVRWHPDHLRALFVGSFDSDRCEISWYQIGDVSQIWRGLPTLRTVILNGGGFTLGDIDAPQLEHLELRTGGLTSANVHSVASAAWPNLRHLDVYFGGHSYGGDTELADVDALLANPFPALRHLGIMNCPFTDEAVAALVASPLAAQLEELDLSLGCLGDAGAALLLGLPKLKKVDISSSFVSDVVRAQLAARFEVVATEMNAPDAERYVAISE